MNRDAIPAPAGAMLGRVLRELLFDPTAVNNSGAGLTLVEVLVELTRAADRLASAIEEFNRRQT